MAGRACAGGSAVCIGEWPVIDVPVCGVEVGRRPPAVAKKHAERGREAGCPPSALQRSPVANRRIAPGKRWTKGGRGTSVRVHPGRNRLVVGRGRTRIVAIPPAKGSGEAGNLRDPPPEVVPVAFRTGPSVGACEGRVGIDKARGVLSVRVQKASRRCRRRARRQNEPRRQQKQRPRQHPTALPEYHSHRSFIPSRRYLWHCRHLASFLFPWHRKHDPGSRRPSIRWMAR